MDRRSEVDEKTECDDREAGSEVDKVLESVDVADDQSKGDTGEC
jgi:hypothetical protein